MAFIFSTTESWAEKSPKNNPFFSNPLFTSLEYLCVTQPKILNFSWKQGQTFGSSPLFLFSVVALYLSFTFLLSRTTLPPTNPHFLRSVKVLHNMFLIALSFSMVIGSSLSVLSHAPTHSIICLPTNTSPEGPLFFWAYVFYLSKIYEFMDTLLIIWSNSSRRLTFLHVYHHAAVVIMCYFSLHSSQSTFPAVIVTNASVHVIMYVYYLLCALGSRPTWKKGVTDCQILQFFASFGIVPLIFYYHFTGEGCSGIWSWCFDAVFIASLLVLFLDFHFKNYYKKAKHA